MASGSGVPGCVHTGQQLQPSPAGGSQVKSTECAPSESMGLHCVVDAVTFVCLCYVNLLR